MPPNFDEFAIHEAEHCCGLDLFFCPVTTLSDDGLTPGFETLSRFEVTLGPFFDKLFVRVSGPFDFSQLALPEKNNEIVTTGRKRDKEYTSDVMEARGIAKVRKVFSKVLGSVYAWNLTHPEVFK